MGLPINVLDGLFGLGAEVIKRLWPDPEKAAQAQMELLKLKESGELQRLAMENGLLQGQIDVNKIEAAHQNLFVAGWRPAIGWTCAAALFMYYVPYCLVATLLWAWQVLDTGQMVARPDLGITDLLGLIAGMLGMSALRTQERLRGVIPPQT